MQLRDTSGKIERVIFNRSSHKDAEERRKRLSKITSFKQGLTNEQLQMLRDRQFVVMDQSKIYGNPSKTEKQPSIPLNDITLEQDVAAKDLQLRAIQDSLKE